MTAAGPRWLPRKRLFQVSAEIHSLFPPSSPSACAAAPQRTACWRRGSTSYTVAERGGVTYIRERQRGGGARGEERGCPNALTGLPGSDIKPRSNEERAWRRAGRGRGEESSAPCLVPSTHHNPTNCSLFLFLCAMPQHKGPDRSLVFAGIPEGVGVEGNSLNASSFSN